MVNHGFSQGMSEVDSLIRQKYYHRIFPKAVNSKANVLYEGIDNFLKIRYPDETSKKFKYVLKTNNGLIVESGDGYITVPRNAGRSFILLFIIGNDKDTFLVGKKEFAVQKVPLPCLMMGSKVIKDQSLVDKAIFYTGDSLKIFFTNDIEDSKYWCSVKYFTLGYSFGGKYISIDNNGALLSKSTLEFIGRLQPRENVDIKVTNIDCSMIYKYLPLIRFQIK
jgi:hypothetical protein